MTTKDFIKKALTGETRKDFCSSVYRYGDTVYSYGYHYPLARIINGKVFVNNRGYSNTTAKHINWAFTAARELGLEAYGVPLFNGRSLTRQDVAESASKELLRIEADKATKKRKDTQVYAQLEYQEARMQAAVKAVA